MFRQFFLVHKRQTAFAWFGCAVFVSHQLFRAWMKYALNKWYQVFYDTLQTAGAELSSGEDGAAAYGREQIAKELWGFALLVSPAIVVHPLAGIIKNFWVLEWRLCLMKEYVRHWDPNIKPIEGAAQRVHEDTQRFAQGIHSCVAIMLDSFLTLVVFCPVLYNLMPSLMASSVAFATGGFLVSVCIGRKLVGLEVQNQVVEAALRKQLVVLEVDPQSVVGDAASGADAAFLSYFQQLRKNYRSLYLNFAALATWLSTYEQAAVILPYIIAAPLLFADHPKDRITLGVLVQITNAFSKVFDSVNVVADNWLSVNEWRSVLVRLKEYEKQLYHDLTQASLEAHPGSTPPVSTIPVHASVELNGV